MDMHQMRRLSAAFAACGESASPLGQRLCAALHQSPAVAELFSQFYRTISAEAPDVRLFMSALHFLSLTGEAPPLSAAGDLDALVRAGRESLLDFMLSQTYRPGAAQPAPALGVGARAAAARFGGGLSLVEFGAGAGLNLLTNLDPVPVVGRYGLDPAPFDLTNPQDRLVLHSFFWPDQVQPLPVPEHPLDIRQGAELLPVAAEAYAAMPPGNTLLVMDALVWPTLSEPEKQQVAWQIQHLAGRLEPHKPLAWVQWEPFGGGAPELRLHTFGWADPEDREVRRIPVA